MVTRTAWVLLHIAAFLSLGCMAVLSLGGPSEVHRDTRPSRGGARASDPSAHHGGPRELISAVGDAHAIHIRTDHINNLRTSWGTVQGKALPINIREGGRTQKGGGDNRGSKKGGGDNGGSKKGGSKSSQQGKGGASKGGGMGGAMSSKGTGTSKKQSMGSGKGSRINCDRYDFRSNSQKIAGAYVSCSPNVLATASAVPSLSTFVNLIDLAGLADIFACPGPFALLAPSNDAFAALDSAAFIALMRRDSQNALQELLLYHVLPGLILSEGPVRTLSGNTVNVALNPTSFNGVASSRNITACNGIIYLIDSILSPDATVSRPPRSTPSPSTLEVIAPSLAPQTAKAPNAATTPPQKSTKAPTRAPQTASRAPNAATTPPQTSTKTPTSRAPNAATASPQKSTKTPTRAPQTATGAPNAATTPPQTSTKTPTRAPQTATGAPNAATASPQKSTKTPTRAPQTATGAPNAATATPQKSTKTPTRAPQTATGAPNAATATPSTTAKTPSLPPQIASSTPNAATSTSPSTTASAPSLPPQGASSTPIAGTTSPPSTAPQPAASSGTPVAGTTSPPVTITAVPTIGPSTITVEAPTAAPSISVPTTNVSVAPTRAMDIRIRVQNFYIAYQAPAATTVPPTVLEYESIRRGTLNTFVTFFTTKFANDLAVTFLSARTALRDTAFGAAANRPSAGFNIYTEYLLADFFYAAGSSPPNINETITLLQSTLNSQYIASVPNMLVGSPFESTTAVVLVDLP